MPSGMYQSLRNVETKPRLSHAHTGRNVWKTINFQCLPTNNIVMWSLVSKAVTESIAISDELKGIPHDLWRPLAGGRENEKITAKHGKAQGGKTSPVAMGPLIRPSMHKEWYGVPSGPSRYMTRKMEVSCFSWTSEDSKRRSDVNCKENQFTIQGLHDTTP